MLSEERRTAARDELSRLCSELNELAGDLTQPLEESPAAAIVLAAPASRWRRLAVSPLPARLVTAAGVVLIAGGLWVAAHPLLGLVERSRTDQSALAQWRQIGSHAVVGSVAQPPVTGGAPGGAAVPATTAACGGTSPSDAYALLAFPSLPQDNYSAVAGNGDWDLLRQRSVVHFSGSAAPGARGNAIIAFHREPGFQDIDHLVAGDRVTVQDRGCRVWTYVVRQRWVLAPDKVTQLVPTSDAELTLITCDPWFRDVNRLVWRATLSGAGGS